MRDWRRAGHTERDAVRLLPLLPDLASVDSERLHNLARWANELYPGPRWWNPLEPDLLGEYLGAAHLTEYPAVLAGVLDRDDQAALVQPLTVYVRAAPDYSTFAQAVQLILGDHIDQLVTTALSTPSGPLPDLLERALRVAPQPGKAARLLNRLPESSGQTARLALALAEQAVDHERCRQGQGTVDPADLPRALSALAHRLGEVGRWSAARIVAERAVALCHDPSTGSGVDKVVLTNSLLTLGMVYRELELAESAQVPLRESEELSRTIDDRHLRAAVLAHLGINEVALASHQGSERSAFANAAVAHLGESLRITELRGDDGYASWVLVHLGLAAQAATGDPTRRLDRSYGGLVG